VLSRTSLEEKNAGMYWIMISEWACKTYDLKVENMKIGLTDSGQNLLGDFCEHENKIRDPSYEGINFFIL
jgi:hypothetical protein